MDLDEKRKRIESIRDEVGELHPLLENILPRLPNVCSYEYTHGPSERGADFIVEIENPTTGRRSHVGVVVKAGKIGAAKVAEVEDQIRECAEERPYKVGAMRVRCTSVWVFASGGYSERAKEKILERLSGRSVDFFSATDIAGFIDSHHGYFWDDLPPGVGAYLQQLQTKLDVLDKATELLASPTGDGCYIELDTFERIKKNYTQTNGHPEFKNVDFLHEALDVKVALLEAEMGFGKSKLARRLASSLCNAASFQKHRTLPVFSTYRNFVDSYDSDLEALVKAQLSAALPCLADPKIGVLIILDGIDECSSPNHTSSELFEKLTQDIRWHDSFRVLVTTRPLKSFSDKVALYRDARTFGIRPLSLAKIVRYLETTCSKQSLPKRLFEDLKRSPLFKQLPHSPIAAALFSNLLAQTRQEVPQSLTELYAKSIELMLGRWEQKKEMATEKQFKTAQLIAEQLACYFVDNRLVYCAKVEVDEIIASYLGSRNVGVTQADIEALLFARSNIFSLDDEAGTLAFRHRSFAEYLCAQRKARNRSLLVREAALDPYWTNVFFFYVGTIMDCPEVLTELRGIAARDEMEEWMKLISVPSYLLAAYQTEFDEVEANVLVVLVEAAKLYLRVKSGDTKTKLTSLPEMQLLYLFKSLIIENFGFEFFARGFDTLALRIDELLEEEEVKAYSLFFLSCAQLDCGSDAGFRYLLTKKGTNAIPLPLSLAARCELESSTHVENGRLLKDHKDKLRKLLLGAGKVRVAEHLAVQGSLDVLFRKPLVARLASPKPLAGRASGFERQRKDE